MENDGILEMLDLLVFPKVFQLWRRCWQPGGDLEVHFQLHEVLRGPFLVKVRRKLGKIMELVLKSQFCMFLVQLCVFYMEIMDFTKKLYGFHDFGWKMMGSWKC